MSIFIRVSGVQSSGYIGARASRTACITKACETAISATEERRLTEREYKMALANLGDMWADGAAATKRLLAPESLCDLHTLLRRTNRMRARL